MSQTSAADLRAALDFVGEVQAFESAESSARGSSPACSG